MITLKQRLAEIAKPYKICSKKLKLKYKNYKSFSWETKVKIRRCVAELKKSRKK
jgi:hypothetical protein